MTETELKLSGPKAQFEGSAEYLPAHFTCNRPRGFISIVFLAHIRILILLVKLPQLIMARGKHFYGEKGAKQVMVGKQYDPP